MKKSKLIYILNLLIFSLAPLVVCAQNDSISKVFPEKLSVGVYEKPPFIILGENNTWDGLSIRLWRSVAEDLDLDYDLVKLPAESSTEALQGGKVDLVLLGEVTAENEELIDFSHVYYNEVPGIASSEDISLTSIAKSFFTKRFWYIVGVLSVLLLIVGTIIYFVERRKNEDNFGGERSIAHGIGAGFWWAGVTMTTIGYGDKAPVTFLGRAIALFWMLLAMAVTAVLTASLVSVVGNASGEKLNFPDDLRKKNVAVVKNSEAEKFLKTERISANEFQNAAAAIKAVKDKEQDLVFHSLPALRYELSNGSGSLKARGVPAPATLYAFGMPADTNFRKEINVSLLKVLKSALWQQELKRFVPEQ
jgi:polar amino acid transport system substrate-binding protein